MSIVRQSRADLERADIDWARVRRTTDKDIDGQIAADSDTSPLLTAEDFDRAKVVRPSASADDVKPIHKRLGVG